MKTANNLGLDFIGIGKKSMVILNEQGCNKYFDDLKGIDLDDL